MRKAAAHLAAISAIALAASAVFAGQAQADGYPVNWDVLTATATGAALNIAPPGANVPCTPDATHPEPVVLVHGIFGNQNTAWQALAPLLANDGYCVYTLTYGQTWYSGNLGGVDYLSNSAAELHEFVDQVLAQTGASQVDLVGYSEGGFVSRLYMKTYGSQDVSQFVGISPVNSQPPTFSGILTYAYQIPGATALVGVVSPAFEELSTQPAFTALNTPSATFGNVIYTDIATTTDEVATPPDPVSFLPAGPNVTNENVQSFCPDDSVGHLGMPYDVTTVQLVLNALDEAQARPVPCGRGFPF